MHGHQQLSLFNAHYDERCFLPIHVYDTERSRPVAVVLRPGKTPSGIEVRAHLRRLVLHTAAYWLMLAVRDAIPKARDLAKAEFATLRLRLIKIAARVVETASRVRLAFAACCPEADLFRGLPAALMPCGP